METKNLLNKKITQWLLLVAMLFGFSGALSADKYVYFDSNKGDWEKDGSASACHYWGGTGSTWPGNLMTKVSGESHIWYYKVPSGNGNCMFVRVSSDGKSDWGAKTSNQITPSSTDKNLCKMTSFAWGECSASFSDYYALTPTAVTLTVTDGKLSGSGTSSDPYMVEAGGKFTLSASNLTFSPTDPDMKGYYYFGTSSTGTPNSDTSSAEITASSTVGTKTQYYVVVKGKYNTTTSSSTKSASVYVQTKVSCTTPTAGSITASPASPICKGTSTTLTIAGYTAGSTLQWYKGSTILTDETSESYSTEDLSEDATYKVVVSNNGCTSETAPITINVQEPTLTIALTSAAGGDKVYVWEPATFTPTTDGTITDKTITRQSGSGAFIVEDGANDAKIVKAGKKDDVFRASFTTSLNGCTKTVTKEVTVEKAVEVCQ